MIPTLTDIDKELQSTVKVLACVATTHVDSHGERFTEHALRRLMEDKNRIISLEFNSGQSPVGRVDNFEIINLLGRYYLWALATLINIQQAAAEQMYIVPSFTCENILIGHPRIWDEIQPLGWGLVVAPADKSLPKVKAV